MSGGPDPIVRRQVCWHRPPRLLVHLLMLLAAVLVSTSFTVGAAVTAALDPAVLTLIRFIVAALVMAPIVYLRGELHFSWNFTGRCAIISGALVIFFWCMFLALRYTSALNTSVIFTLVPPLSGIYAWFLLRERLPRAQLGALFFGMVGALWVISRGDLGLLWAMHWNRGDLIFLAGCLAMGLYAPLIKLFHRGESMLAMSFWVLVTGCGWLLLLGGGRIAAVSWPTIALSTWLAIGYLAVFTTVITFFLTQFCVTFIGPTQVTAYSYLYPTLVLLIELFLGHGLPPPAVLPGVAVVLLAMVVLQFAPSDGPAGR
ncbi:MAG: DMT family transporter [Desulfopila sp.]